MKQTTISQENNEYKVHIYISPDDDSVQYAEISFRASFRRGEGEYGTNKFTLKHRHPTYILMRILQIIDENKIRGAELTIIGLSYAFRDGTFRLPLMKTLESYARLKGFTTVDISML